MEISTLVNSHGFKFKKQLGQNFITDLNLLNAIVSDAKVSALDTVLEVGAGAGTLTAALCAKAGKVISLEVDKSLQPALEELTSKNGNLTVNFADALKMSDKDINDMVGGNKFRLVANLPYYITTPLIFKFLYNPLLTSFTVMVQKEVALRIAAVADTADYGALSAQLQVMGTPKITRIVGRQLFTPPPEVDSAIIHLEINPLLSGNALQIYRRTVAAAFAMRRKTLVNNIISSFSLNRDAAVAAVQEVGLSALVRGEQLTVQNFMQLSTKLAGK